MSRRVRDEQQLNEMLARGGARVAGVMAGAKAEVQAAAPKAGGKAGARGKQANPFARASQTFGGVRAAAAAAGGTPAMFALGRLQTREMNKTEAAYDRLLAARLQAGEIHWFAFEALKLRLADDTFYTPDFAVIEADGVLTFHEVKGHWMDDAKVKFKVAREAFPFRFRALRQVKAKLGGGWAEDVL